MGYEYNGSRWVEKAGHAPAKVDLDTDEEAEMDIPLPSPTTPTSPHSLHSALIIASGSSSTRDWYHDLSKHIDTLNLDLQALFVEHDSRFGVLESQQDEILRILRSQFPPSQ